MSYDIYGNPLRRGHCEVHPHVHEEYPCSVCLAEKRQHDRERQGCDGNPAHCESAHYLGQAQEEITRLSTENARLRGVLNLALEYWADRQQRYKNRAPAWVQQARAALSEQEQET